MSVIHRSVRTGTLVVCCTAALFGLPSRARAQTTTVKVTQRLQGSVTLDDPCSSEPVNVNFDETHQLQVQVGNTTSVRDSVHEQGTGTGTSSLAQYQFSSMNDVAFRFTTQTSYLRVTVRDHLVRQGPSGPNDNEFETHTLLFVSDDAGNVNVTHQNDQIACR